MRSILQLLTEIRPNPVLYIGTHDIQRLYAFVSGYAHACSLAGLLPKDDGDWLYHGFRVYLAVRYNDTTARNWAGLIELHEPDGSSTYAFYRLLDEYMHDSRWYPYDRDAVCAAEAAL